MPNILPGPFDECVGKFHAAGAIYPQDKNAPTHECAVCEIEVVEIFHPSMLEAGWYG